ncbi:MAG: hypothetical protein MI784_09820 [Cytophagales bacterium]|nr:hypothetical protein [Cytophagales bacterium]
MDPVSGHIKAWVGGINHKYFQYDHVMVGKRQPGSTFKPIVYAAAIDNGFSPCDKVTDQPYSYTMANGENWVPQNATGRYTNQDLTLRQAMARSVNSITAYVMNKVGPEEVVKYAKRLGIKSPLQAVPALALGVNDVSLYDMVGAYSTFINKGVHTKPKFLTRIEDKFGNVIHEFPPEKSEVLNEETAYLMTYMLRGTTEEIGGSAARLIPLSAGGLEIGGKTGTTQNASDGWFISVTKDLVCGAWTGGDNRAIRFRHWADGQGARTALPEVKNFLENVYGDSTLGYEKGIFPRPQTISRELNCDVLTSKAEEALRKAEEESLPDSLKTEEPKPVEVPEINEDDLNF